MLYGEHIHRLFRLNVRNASAESLAHEALTRLNFDHKRKTLLQSLQALFIEEISLLSGETFAAMEMIMRSLKGNDESFGGTLIIANGDVCQLPNISGCNIFEACLLLFTFDFHFLEKFVRMEDPVGQELLLLLEKRPVSDEDAERVIEIMGSSCNFVENWEQIENPMIMKVFGKRAAEKKAIESHFSNMRQRFGTLVRTVQADDQIRSETSHAWHTANAPVCEIDFFFHFYFSYFNLDDGSKKYLFWKRKCLKFNINKLKL